MGRAGGPPVRRRDRADRRGRALGACRAVRRPRSGGRGREPRRPAAARAPVGAAWREPRLRGLLRLLADRAARGRRSAHVADDCGARNSPVRQGHRAAGGGEVDGLLLPDHRARPRRRHRPGPPALRRRGAPLPGFRPARRHRPLRGGARRRDARAAREPGAGSIRGCRPARHGRAQRLPLARLGRRRRDRERSRGRPRGRAARQPPHGRRGCRWRALRGDLGRRHRRRRRGEQVVRDGRHRAGDVGRLLTDAISAVRR